MKDKYCLPIINSDLADIRQKIETSEPDYGYFEIWIDYIENFEAGSVIDLIDKYPGRIVVVFRRQSLEAIKMRTRQRFELLDSLSGKDCLVDLDITCQKEDLEYAQGKDLKKIVSYHNYDATPEDAELNKIVETIKSYQPYILKISSMCNEASDAIRLIEIKKDFMESGEKHIILGMGKEGEITRVFGALWGNALIFIPETTNEASAPGQISREEFDKIMERVKK